MMRPRNSGFLRGSDARRAARGAGRAAGFTASALVVLGLALAAAAPLHAETLARELHPLARQTTDAAIASDLALIEAWRLKLNLMTGADRDLWRAAAARAWLTTARAEYVDNDRTGYPQAAFARAVTLIEEIERGADPASYKTVATAVPPRGSMRVADSLYADLERMKRDPGFLCAAEPLANLEMELAWAGNEQVDQGDCKSSPHLARARQLAGEASRLVEMCQPPLLAEPRTPIAVLPMPKIDTVAVPQVIIPTVEELKIARNVHFGLDRDDISPASRSVIEGIAKLLLKYPSITVRLEGHTDSRGNADYNLALSKRRVEAARQVFMALGVDSSRMSIAYKGKSELLAPEDSKRGYALNRRVEMVFVDSEGRDIEATRQEGDLQLESDRTNPAPAKTVTPRHRTSPPAKKPGAKSSGAAKPPVKTAPKKPAGR